MTLLYRDSTRVPPIIRFLMDEPHSQDRIECEMSVLWGELAWVSGFYLSGNKTGHWVKSATHALSLKHHLEGGYTVVPGMMTDLIEEGEDDDYA